VATPKRMFGTAVVTEWDLELGGVSGFEVGCRARWWVVERSQVAGHGVYAWSAHCE
jgi:hypothetical protein